MQSTAKNEDKNLAARRLPVGPWRQNVVLMAALSPELAITDPIRTSLRRSFADPLTGKMTPVIQQCNRGYSYTPSRIMRPLVGWLGNLTAG